MSVGKDGREYDGFASFPAGGPAVSECNPRIACRMRTDGHWEAVHDMPEHLPECPVLGFAPPPAPEPLIWPRCLCAALRACEQRVTAPSHYWDLGYEAGVQAARAVVANEPKALSVSGGEYEAIWRDKTLAAIDALRGEGYSDSHQPQVDGTERPAPDGEREAAAKYFRDTMKMARGES